MNIAIVSNISDGIGLARDYELLRYFLEGLGHEVEGFQFDKPVVAEKEGHFDVAIFLEVTPRNLMGLSERRWLFANPEWITHDMIPIIDRSFEKIFAKTEEAERILEERFPGRVSYTGFLTRDQYDPHVKREQIFLHIPGNSLIRGTEAVLDAWRWKKNGKRLESKLIVIGTKKFSREGLEDDNRVQFFDRIPEGHIKTLQNLCLYHLFPSGTEGWGHALHEALSVGAMLITTGQPPMSEIRGAYFLPSVAQRKYNLATVHEVSALDIFEAVQCVKQMSESDVAGQDMRTQFLQETKAFANKFTTHLDASARKIVRNPRNLYDRPTIAFIGNFEAPESTENQIKWALENRLNYAVEQLQENRVNLAAIREAAEWNDILFWVRTPKWLQVENQAMLDFLGEMVEKAHKPTVSIHLDKFFGIPAREKYIGLDAFWKTQYVFTADGSRQHDFDARGVNHLWMPPAVSEVYCHPGTPRDHFRCDVGFVGAKDYHAEYPFRRQMVEMLEQTYGERFRHITNVRGHDLNDFYASCKVVVGDCIFAGTPKYWSDRVPETAGRGGFLLHPFVDGMRWNQAMLYKAQDLVDLQCGIENALLLTDFDRHNSSAIAIESVREYDTWTRRLQWILGVVNGKAVHAV